MLLINSDLLEIADLKEKIQMQVLGLTEPVANNRSSLEKEL